MDKLLTACEHQQPYVVSRNTASGISNLCLLIIETFPEWQAKYADSRDRLEVLLAICIQWLHVLQAFGVEVALKGVLRKVGTNPKKTHNLAKLYRQLPDQAKQQLSYGFAAIAESKNLEEILENHATDFDAWRYLEEDSADSTDIDPETLIRAIDVCVKWMDLVDPCDCERPNYFDDQD